MHRIPARFLLAGAVVTFPVATFSGQSDPELIVRTVRFYRPQQGQTRVKGLIQIPYTMLEQAGATGSRGYTVSVRVSDSTGLTLLQQVWRNRVSNRVTAEAYTVEIVDFALAPGIYRIEVGVQDSASGRTVKRGTELRALSDTDAASDLLVAPEIRLASADDTVPNPGEFRTGNNLVTAVAQVRLTPLRSILYYLLEAYTDSASGATMSVAIRDSSHQNVVTTPALPVKVGRGGTVLKGQLDLAGLPEGHYTILATLKHGDRVIERSADFRMAGLGETLARDSATRRTRNETKEGYFETLDEAQLDSAQAPLMYIAENGELSVWQRNMSLNAKRRFLANFWQKRDPTPGTDRNERREQFYEAVAYANRVYAEGGRKGVAGWRTYRGRIYARHGVPDNVLRRPHGGRSPSNYEVWRYTQGRGNFYIFVDRTGFDAYQLIYSNDLKEPGVPDWDRVLGGDAVGDISEFLNIDLFADIRRQDMVPGRRF